MGSFGDFKIKLYKQLCGVVNYLCSQQMVGKEKSSAPVRVHVDAMQGGESPQLQEGVVSPQLQGDVVSLQLEEDVVPPQLKDNIVQSDIPATGSPLGDPPQDGVLQGFALVYFENFSSPEIETELVALNQDILPDTDDIDITANEIDTGKDERRLENDHQTIPSQGQSDRDPK